MTEVGLGCREAFEVRDRCGVRSLGDELLATAFDAGEGVESGGDLGRVHPGLELFEREVVVVAEVEGGEVGVEQFAEEEGGVGWGRQWAMGNRQWGRLCEPWVGGRG